MGESLDQLIRNSEFALLDNNFTPTRKGNWFNVFNNRLGFINIDFKFYKYGLEQIERMIKYISFSNSYTVDGVVNEWVYVFNILKHSYDKRLDYHDRMLLNQGDRQKYKNKNPKNKKQTYLSEANKKKRKYDGILLKLDSLIKSMEDKTTKYGNNLFKIVSSIRDFLPPDLISRGLLSGSYQSDEQLISVCIDRAINGKKTDLFTRDFKIRNQLKYTLFLISKTPYIIERINFPNLKEIYNLITIYSVNNDISREVINKSALRNCYN